MTTFNYYDPRFGDRYQVFMSNGEFVGCNRYADGGGPILMTYENTHELPIHIRHVIENLIQQHSCSPS